MAKTADKPKGIITSNDVLRGHLHGAGLAAGRLKGLKRSSGRSKKGKAKVKIVRPPPGGWV